jgi:lipopolysaccharide/colanic/teichoic acid biosynthesis glycosyltransferase
MHCGEPVWKVVDPAREGPPGVPFLESGIAALVLLLLSPFLLAMAAWVKLVSPGPALFVTERVGKDGAMFRLFKLRTMVPTAPQLLTDDLRTIALEDDHRYIRGGAFLRKGFDEIFQLFNIVRREMRFVGPRPDLFWMREKYLPEAWPRLSVAPGITGWAQINGSRGELSTRERYLLDLWYVAHRNVWLDLMIAFWTPLYLVAGVGLGRRVRDRCIASMSGVGPLFIGDDMGKGAR